MAVAPQRIFANPAMSSYTPSVTSQQDPLLQSRQSSRTAMPASISTTLGYGMGYIPSGTSTPSMPCGGACTPSMPCGGAGTPSMPPPSMPCAAIAPSMGTAMPRFTGAAVNRLSSGPQSAAMTPPVPPPANILTPRGSLQQSYIVPSASSTTGTSSAAVPAAPSGNGAASPPTAMPPVPRIPAGGITRLVSSPPSADAAIVPTQVRAQSPGLVRQESNGPCVIRRAASGTATPCQTPTFSPSVATTASPVAPAGGPSNGCGCRSTVCACGSACRLNEDETLQSDLLIEAPAPSESNEASVDRRISAPQASATNSAVGSRASLIMGHSNPKVERFITRIGLSLGLKASEIHSVSLALDSAGFATVDSLQNLSEELAEELDVPQHMAGVLREEAYGRPPWMKLGPLPPYQRSEDEDDGDGWAGCQAPATLTHSPRGLHALESVTSRGHSTWAQLSGGLQLRDVGNRSPWRRAQSPSEERAFKAHQERHEEGRTQRCYDLHEMRVSNKRRDKTPDPWMETSSFKRSSAVVIPKAGNSRSMAFAQWPERARDVCGDIAPTITDENGGWGGSPMDRQKSNRSGVFSPTRSAAASSTVSALHSPRSRKSPPPQSPREAVSGPSPVPRVEVKARQPAARQRTPNKTQGIPSRQFAPQPRATKTPRGSKETGTAAGEIGSALSVTDSPSTVVSTTTAGSSGMYRSVTGTGSCAGSCILKNGQGSKAFSFPGTPPVPPTPRHIESLASGASSVVEAVAGPTQAQQDTEEDVESESFKPCSTTGCSFQSVGELNGRLLCKGCLIHNALELTVGSRPVHDTRESLGRLAQEPVKREVLVPGSLPEEMEEASQQGEQDGQRTPP